MRITHLTSAHARNDTRIFLKQCRSLAAAGYNVTLVVADGLAEETREGVHVLDVGRPLGRFDRMAGATRRVLRQALRLDADVYHLHDPELLPAGLALKRRGKRVIFDAHEDLPQQILSKPYLHPAARRSISVAMARFEAYACRRLDMVIAATPAIRDKFTRLGVVSTDINNFPMLGELESGSGWAQKRDEVCYVGGIAAIRGVRQVVEALGLLKTGTKLNLAGRFSEKAVEDEVRRLPGWDRVNELGFVDRAGVRDILSRSMAGLVTFLPEPNHIRSQPNKMFEYMSAGVPVIGSNFPLWREIIEGNECGICVDPQRPEEIAAAIDRLAGNPETARQMGENGRRAVEERYNWAAEERKLFGIYSSLN